MWILLPSFPLGDSRSTLKAKVVRHLLLGETL